MNMTIEIIEDVLENQSYYLKNIEKLKTERNKTKIQTYEKLLVAANSLNTFERDFVKLYYIDHLKIKDISEKYNVSRQTVSKLKRKILFKIQQKTLE